MELIVLSSAIIGCLIGWSLALRRKSLSSAKIRFRLVESAVLQFVSFMLLNASIESWLVHRLSILGLDLAALLILIPVVLRAAAAHKGVAGLLVLSSMIGIVRDLAYLVAMRV